MKRRSAAEAFERAAPQRDYAAPLPQQHDEPARHMRSRTTTPRATPRCSRHGRPSKCTSQQHQRPCDEQRRARTASKLLSSTSTRSSRRSDPKGFGVRSDPHRASDGKVWETFYEAVESSLNGPYADLAFASPEEVRTTVRSSSRYQVSETRSLRRTLWKTPSRPLVHQEKVFVGLVQQNCDQKQHDAYGCKTAVMPSDMRVHDMDADVDCVRAYCARSNAKCDTIRVVRFNESETFGPVFGRYVRQPWQGRNLLHAGRRPHYFCERLGRCIEGGLRLGAVQESCL